MLLRTLELPSKGLVLLRPQVGRPPLTGACVSCSAGCGNFCARKARGDGLHQKKTLELNKEQAQFCLVTPAQQPKKDDPQSALPAFPIRLVSNTPFEVFN